MTTKMPVDIKAGDILVARGSDSRIIASGDAEESDVMPGMFVVENAIGVLYLDADFEVEVEGNDDD